MQSVVRVTEKVNTYLLVVLHLLRAKVMSSSVLGQLCVLTLEYVPEFCTYSVMGVVLQRQYASIKS